ncbi:MAG: hypothetical protein KF865_08500 [Bdellovibrionaceae bacterium]|nr:hypothetical protein [Pseudobdellovibrionaceae bacterium]
MSRHLDVILSVDSATPSFNPLDSDGMINAIHVEQMVGTLVRMHPSGRYEGYLASTWSNSKDFKRWNFKLREQLVCEDGTPINAVTFSESLIRTIRLVKKHSKMPLIERLIGFSEIETKDSIDGIQAIDHLTLQLNFSKPVEAGILEYLALPYLGFYCENNFNADGSWKDNKSIISSASYKISDWHGEGPLTLKRRNDWFSLSENPPETIKFYLKALPNDIVLSENSFIFNFNLKNDGIPNTHNEMRLTPSIFHALVVSVSNNEWLQLPTNRHFLKNEIKRVQNIERLTLNGAITAHTLYPHLSNPTKQSDGDDVASKNIKAPLKPLVIAVIENASEAQRYINDVLFKALDNLAIPYKVISQQKTQENLMSGRRNDTKYDIRSLSVDSGGGIENQLIKFMFCSNLGISFPDPSHKICSLVDRYENLFGDAIPSEEMKKYVVEFDKILNDDAAVIPMLKTGHSWHLSPSLSSSAVSPTMGIPYFDLFSIK